MSIRNFLHNLSILTASMALTGCSGILSDVYDDPPAEDEVKLTQAGTLYIDASNWTEWHYIDLAEIADATAADPDFNPSSAWVTLPVEMEQTDDTSVRTGIYTNWYDVFGQGISRWEPRDFYPTPAQPAPEHWSLAVHRNNFRTNGAEVAMTAYEDIDEMPMTLDYVKSLPFRADEWNTSDVWVVQDQMLLGLIGCQGIEINPTLSDWLHVDIPPIPPAFTLNPKVMVMRLSDGTYAALQLENYLSASGTKCCMTINYKYPLNLK